MNTSEKIGLIIGVVVGIILIITIVFIIVFRKDDKKEQKYEKMHAGGLTKFSMFFLDTDNILYLYGWDFVYAFIDEFKKFDDKQMKKYKKVLPACISLSKNWMNYKINNKTIIQRTDTKINEILEYIFKDVKIYENHRELITQYPIYKTIYKKHQEEAKKIEQNETKKLSFDKFMYYRTEIMKLKNAFNQSRRILKLAKSEFENSNDMLLNTYINFNEIDKIEQLLKFENEKITNALKSIKKPTQLDSYSEQLNELLNKIDTKDNIKPYIQGTMWKLSDFEPVLDKILELTECELLKDSKFKEFINCNHQEIQSKEVIYQDVSNFVLNVPEEMFKFNTEDGTEKQYNESYIRDIYCRFWYQTSENKFRELIDKLAASNTSLSHDDHYPANLQKWILFIIIVKACMKNESIFADVDSNNIEKTILNENKLKTELIKYLEAIRLNIYAINIIINALSPIDKNFAKGYSFKHTFGSLLSRILDSKPSFNIISK